jgi:hypothetical protein
VTEERVTLFTSEGLIQIGGSLVYIIYHIVSLLLTMSTDNFKHMVLFLYGSFVLLLKRRNLMVMRITFSRLREIGEILLIIMLHELDKITAHIFNFLLLLNAHSNKLLNFSVFMLRVVVNLKSLKFLGQGMHD